MPSMPFYACEATEADTDGDCTHHGYDESQAVVPRVVRLLCFGCVSRVIVIIHLPSSEDVSMSVTL